MSAPGRLILVGGPPAAGKSTLAHATAERLGAVLLSPDDWLAELDVDLRDAAARHRIERLQRRMALTLLPLSVDVVLDWGVFHASARDRLREDARALGAPVELHFLDEPRDVLWERIQQRADGGGQPAPTRAEFDAMIDDVQPPDAAERGAFDPPA